MPNMNGFEATNAIQCFQQQNGQKKTPIIALTANAFDNDRTKCLKAGMDDYISKPATRKQLSEILARWLKPKIKSSNASHDHVGIDVPTSFQQINESELKALADINDPEDRIFLETLINSYLHDTNESLIQLQQRIDNDDFVEIAKIAHRLKSASANLTAHDLSMLFKTLEEAVKQSNKESINEVWLKIQKAYKASSLEFKDYLK